MWTFPRVEPEGREASPGCRVLRGSMCPQNQSQALPRLLMLRSSTAAWLPTGPIGGQILSAFSLSSELWDFSPGNTLSPSSLANPHAPPELAFSVFFLQELVCDAPLPVRWPPVCPGASERLSQLSLPRPAMNFG